MSDQPEWTIVKNKKQVPKNSLPLKDKKKSFKNKLNVVCDDFSPDEDDNQIEEIDDSKKLPFKFVFWCHDIYSKDWTLNGYRKLCSIETINHFWRLMNNLQKIGFKINNFYIMREDTEPIWEHENNRNGGVCSFRTSIESSLGIFEDLCTKMVCNQLNDKISDINGISFSPKNNWALIKIWNRDKQNDLTKTMNPEIIDKYKDLSIKYLPNEPEY